MSVPELLDCLRSHVVNMGSTWGVQTIERIELGGKCWELWLSLSDQRGGGRTFLGIPVNKGTDTSMRHFHRVVAKGVTSSVVWPPR